MICELLKTNYWINWWF